MVSRTNFDTRSLKRLHADCLIAKKSEVTSEIDQQARLVGLASH